MHARVWAAVINGKTKTKQSSREKKEIEEQVPTRQVSLVTVRENFLLFIPKFATFLLLGSRFCFSFNPKTFLFPRTFHVHQMISLATRTTTLECKQKMLISWNRISRIKPLPRKPRRVVHAFLGLWHLDGSLTLLKNLFFSITRARFEILFSFFRNILALIMTFHLAKKKFFGQN